ncbi:hypothetical protein HK096_010334, partial [Nowakowskiella sp. JEL0078]
MKLPKLPIIPTFAPFQICNSIPPPADKPRNPKHSLPDSQPRQTHSNITQERKNFTVLSPTSIKSTLTHVSESNKIHTRNGSSVIAQQCDVMDEKSSEIENYHKKSESERISSKYKLLPSISQTKILINKDVSTLHHWNTSLSSTSKASVLGPDLENDDYKFR